MAVDLVLPSPYSRAQNAALLPGPSIVLPFVRIDCPDALSTEPTHINNAGKVVGFCTDTSDHTHGFEWAHGKLQLLDFPGAVSTGAIGMNSKNVIVGFYYDDSGLLNGFRYTGGVFTTFDVPPKLGNNTSLTGINDVGDAVGTYEDASSNSQSFRIHRRKARSVTFPGSTDTVVYDINNNGDMVGYYFTPQNDVLGFLFQGGVFTTVQSPIGGLALPTGINNQGEIVGYLYEGSQTQIFTYSGDVFQTYDLQGGTITILHFELFGINDSRQITGPYVDNLGITHGFLAQLPD
jgi:probable HAF family extracellular repeat protein